MAVNLKALVTSITTLPVQSGSADTHLFEIEEGSSLSENIFMDCIAFSASPD
jgi:hypothetical protein